ncbi:MAG: deoxyribose-phosphate aldolase [Bacillota bacterium]|jgi:deoxyribose-phosphate aldolase
MTLSKQEIARLIDHTYLKPDAASGHIERLCLEGVQHNFFSVCVPPAFVRLARSCLEGTPVKTCTVIGFPLGFNTPAVKCFEAETAVRDGAQEVDMVINIGALHQGLYDYIEKEINLVAASIPEDVVLKVIIETALLSREQKRAAAQIVLQSDAHFIKTSTGYAKGGATLEDVKLLKSILGDTKKIKASGGIRTLDFAQQLVKAGASRLGCSSSVEIMEGAGS